MSTSPRADSDRRALVTGGGTGIGYAIAARLLARGVSVLICGRRREVIVEAASKLGATTGGRVESAVIDLAEPAAAPEAVEACVSAFGGIEILVNNAGLGEYCPFEEITVEGWDRSQDVMVRAPMLAIQAAAPLMAEAGGGRIVNVSSVNGLINEPNSAQYSVAKAGLISLTRSAAIDFAALGIRTNAIAPGWIETPMSAAFITSTDPDDLKGINMLGRVGTPDEIGVVAEFLALDAPDFLTGQTISVDGGQTRWSPESDPKRADQRRRGGSSV